MTSKLVFLLLVFFKRPVLSLILLFFQKFIRFLHSYSKQIAVKSQIQDAVYDSPIFPYSDIADTVSGIQSILPCDYVVSTYVKRLPCLCIFSSRVIWTDFSFLPSFFQRGRSGFSYWSRTGFSKLKCHFMVLPTFFSSLNLLLTASLSCLEGRSGRLKVLAQRNSQKHFYFPDFKHLPFLVVLKLISLFQKLPKEDTYFQK